MKKIMKNKIAVLVLVFIMFFIYNYYNVSVYIHGEELSKLWGNVAGTILFMGIVLIAVSITLIINWILKRIL